jgi:hypothetical protein
VLGPVGELVVEVDERALDLSQPLELLLEGLTDVVRLLQSHVRRKHDVHLHEVVGAERVGTHRVDVPHGLVVVPAQIGQLLEVLRRGRLPNQGVNVFQHRHRPCSDRVDRQLQRRGMLSVSENTFTVKWRLLALESCSPMERLQSSSTIAAYPEFQLKFSIPIKHL